MPAAKRRRAGYSKRRISLWNDRLRFAERVSADWAALAAEKRAGARVVLEALDNDPILGAPLLPPLRGLWVVRHESLRIVYALSPEARNVVVLSISEAASE